ncbi:MAG TPA: rRNA maturation RNase YbeY [Rhodothermales bacterium]
MPDEDASVRIQVENAHPDLDVDHELLRHALLRTLQGEGKSVHALTVVLADHGQVLSLNRDYLDHDYETDVLSFDLSESDATDIEGEIYIDLDTAQERHAEFGAGFEEEVRRYAIHGLLHLIGYLDDTPEQREQMHRLETRYLNDAS